MKRYSKAIKAKIVEATQAARKEGKKWKDALDAAKSAGYCGSLQGIEKMIRDIDKKAGNKAGYTGKRRGRKPGRKPGRTYTKLDPVAKFVNKLVEQKLRERVRLAIRALKGI